MTNLVIGIAGDSCSGKTTLCNLVEKLLGHASVLVWSGDNYHVAERADPLWQKTTHLDPTVNRLSDYAKDLETLKHGQAITSPIYDHTIGKFTLPQTFDSRPIILANGLHTLYTPELREVCDIKIYLEMDDRLRERLKINRDINERGYTKEKAIAQLSRRMNDSERFIKSQKEYADIIIRLSSLESLDENSSPILSIHTQNQNLLFNKLTDSIDMLRLPDSVVENLRIILPNSINRMQGHQYAASSQHHSLAKDIASNSWMHGLNGMLQFVMFSLLMMHVRAEPAEIHKP